MLTNTHNANSLDTLEGITSLYFVSEYFPRYLPRAAYYYALKLKIIWDMKRYSWVDWYNTRVVILFTFCGPCIVIYLHNKDQQGALFLLNLFRLPILYMFRTEYLFIIKRQLLYMQHLVFTALKIY